MLGGPVLLGRLPSPLARESALVLGLLKKVFTIAFHPRSRGLTTAAFLGSRGPVLVCLQFSTLESPPAFVELTVQGF